MLVECEGTHIMGVVILVEKLRVAMMILRLPVESFVMVRRMRCNHSFVLLRSECEVIEIVTFLIIPVLLSVIECLLD